MPSIITLTLNPAVDKSTAIVSLIPEKKLHCDKPLMEPGGGGINVARAIKRFGANAEAIFLAGGYNGGLLMKLLDAEEVFYRCIPISNDTRENIAVVDKSTNLQYRFLMPGPEVYEREWQQCLQAIEKFDDIEFIVSSGSLPPGVPVDIYARIAAIAKKKNARCVTDTSGLALQLALEEGVFLIKPNLNELSALAGMKELNGKEVAEAAKNIIDSKKCEVVVVSMGAAGVLLVTKDIVQQIVAPPVKVKSTVGAGDCMVAGIVYSLSNGKSIDVAVRYGIACGTAATLNEGTGLCKLSDVEGLFSVVAAPHLV